jgi:4-carboxymuconolactone decarboxylase
VTEPQRLAGLEVATLDPEQRALYDSIVGGPRARGPQHFALTDDTGRLNGPFNAMLLAPKLGAALQALGSSLRYGGTLPDRAREIAILAVARQWDSAFERHAHEAVGRSVGLTDAELAALRAVSITDFADPFERLVAATSFALAARGDLDDAEYAAAERGLGLPVRFELITRVGYYATLALQLRVFRVGVPAQDGTA